MESDFEKAKAIWHADCMPDSRGRCRARPDRDHQARSYAAFSSHHFILGETS